jgi:hypothetical protein
MRDFDSGRESRKATAANRHSERWSFSIRIRNDCNESTGSAIGVNSLAEHRNSNHESDPEIRNLGEWVWRCYRPNRFRRSSMQRLSPVLIGKIQHDPDTGRLQPCGFRKRSMFFAFLETPASSDDKETHRRLTKKLVLFRDGTEVDIRLFPIHDEFAASYEGRKTILFSYDGRLLEQLSDVSRMVAEHTTELSRGRGKKRQVVNQNFRTPFLQRSTVPTGDCTVPSNMHSPSETCPHGMDVVEFVSSQMRGHYIQCSCTWKTRIALPKDE